VPKPIKLGKIAELFDQNAPKVRKEPLWKGPEVDGVTQSLLSHFLCCRERFRLLVVEGMKKAEGWNHRLGYGNMWHACEEAHAERPGDEDHWQRTLQQYVRGEIEQYRFDSAKILRWYNVCRTQFPLYVEYWAEHPEMVSKKPLLQEEAFAVPYTLPSGRTVRLRGKFDSVDLVTKGDLGKGIWLQENKAKGDVNPFQLQAQLKFDLQTMIYLVALQTLSLNDSRIPIKPIRGVRYNVIRRPLSGGKGSIVQKKGYTRKPKNKAEREAYGEAVPVQGESDEEYYARLGEIIRTTYEDNGQYHYFFSRWNVEVSAEDIERFEREFLRPHLESLCDWWEVVAKAKIMGYDIWDPAVNLGRHWRTPYGFYNVLAEGGTSDLDEYLNTGSEVGLERVDNLFPELKAET
jgi:hypothetical protein